MAVLFVLALQCAVPALGAGDPPLLPAAFWGSVNYADGSPVEEGTVEAVVSGAACGSAAVRNGQYGGPGGLEPKLIVSGTEATAGQAVRFRVNGVDAVTSRAVEWQSGEVVRVDLTVPKQDAGANPCTNPEADTNQAAEPSSSPAPGPGGGGPAGGGGGPAGSSSGSTGSGGGPPGGGAASQELEEEQPTGEFDNSKVEDIRLQIQSGGLTPQQAVQQLAGQVAVMARQRISTEARNELRRTVETVMRAAGTLAADKLQAVLGEDNAVVAVNANTVTARLEEMESVGRSLAESLEEAGVADLAAALPKQVVIAAPAGAAEKPGIIVQVPAEAVKAVAGAGANLVVDTGSVSLDMPPGALPAGAVETGVVQIAAECLSGPEAAGMEKNLPSTDAEKMSLAGEIFDINISIGGDSGRGEKVSGLNKPVKLVLKYDPACAGGEPELLGIYNYNEQNGKWEYAGGKVDTEAHTVTAYTRHFSLYAVMALKRNYTDTANHWARREIRIMAARHAVKGTAPDKFSPDKEITRAEFAVIMSRLLGLEADPESAGAFSDIDPGAWYRGMVGAAVRAGLVAGTGPGTFGPGALVTREQVAAMLGRALAWSGAQQVPAEEISQSVLGSYRDAGAISSWAQAGVAIAVEEGLMKGRKVDEFAPAGNCTRAEAAVVLYRLLQKLDLQ